MFAALSLVILATAWSISAEIHLGCPNGWTYYDEDCYYVGRGLVSSEEAEDICMSLGGYLAHVSDFNQDVITSLLNNAESSGTDGAWVGYVSSLRERKRRKVVSTQSPSVWDTTTNPSGLRTTRQTTQEIHSTKSPSAWKTTKNPSGLRTTRQTTQKIHSSKSPSVRETTANLSERRNTRQVTQEIHSTKIPFESDPKNCDVLVAQGGGSWSAGQLSCDSKDAEMMYVCRDGYALKDCFGSSCYTLSEERWHNPCSVGGGHLARIESEKENNFVKSFLKRVPKAADNLLFIDFYFLDYGVFISGNDREREGHWVYDNSSTEMTFFDWSRGQPSSYYNEDCIVLEPKNGFRWDDQKCRQVAYYLCEEDNYNA